MLTQLHIENVAVIESADIVFGPGFNVMTGETGAGKSMVIDSILAIIGERTYRDIIRTGEKRAVVSAVFDCSPDLAMELGAGDSDCTQLAVERQIYADGRNICRINGKPSSLPLLRAAGVRLLSIHGQHDGQRLLSEEYHLQYLDSYADNADVFRKYAEAYEEWSDCRKQLEALITDESEKARLTEILRYQINDIDSASLVPGEDERIESRRKLLHGSQKIVTSLRGAIDALDGNERSDGAVALLGRAYSSYGASLSFSSELEQLGTRLEGLMYEAQDVSGALSDMLNDMTFSPEELEELDSRYDVITRMKKKYGGSVEAVLTFREKCERELDELVFSCERSEKLEKELEKRYNILLSAGRELTASRTSAAKSFEADVADQLAGMDMAGVRLITQIVPSDQPGNNGCDCVRFLLSANIGEEPRPLARIASGGELSRIMLAMQNVLPQNDTVPTLIFDEVDAGISGRAAQAVGEKLAALARKKQVICVTHLPRIAGYGTTHFLIEKGTRNGRTYTSVRNLDRQARVKEIARMTGGSVITRAALESAEEMLVPEQ